MPALPPELQSRDLKGLSGLEPATRMCVTCSSTGIRRMKFGSESDDKELRNIRSTAELRGIPVLRPAMPRQESNLRPNVIPRAFVTRLGRRKRRGDENDETLFWLWGTFWVMATELRTVMSPPVLCDQNTLGVRAGLITGCACSNVVPPAFAAYM